MDGRSGLYDLLKDQPATQVATEIADEDEAIHMHTSGTTGKPKCVVYSNGRYLRHLESMSESLEFTDGMVYQFISQLFHAAGSAAYLVLANGGKLILMQKFQVEEYVASLEREKVNAIGVIPMVLRGILDEADRKNYDLSNLHVINYSTCPISPDLLDRAMARLDCRFYQSYGMTEMSGLVTALRAEDHLVDGGAHLRSVGRPIAGAEIRIVRDDGSECKVGETGEIVAKAYGMMLEYYGRAEQTKEAIRDGWYHTKDLGTKDDKGYVYIRGRKDALIISGGENIYPEEVSNIILKCPQVAEVAVYGVPDEKWGERVKASVVLAPGQTITAKELDKFCRQYSPSYRLPREYEFLAELPKNTTGKVLIEELKKR
ncbi:MAG: AMP-binding protein [Oscillospiraceae bacterium]|nr:AMP-binding protein [Oscillospiraceae bacterium]